MKSARLLIVEDQVVIAADLAERLARQAYEICGVATSAEEALAMARQHRPQLVLMDIRLDGGVDGIDAANALRRELDVPVIFLSSHSDPATLARAKLAGPYGYLTKPFDERDLQLAIEIALHKHAGDQQLAAAHEKICIMNASLERRVRERTADLAALASRAGALLERERTRIARELHDELAQGLAAAKMDATRALEHVAAARTPEAEQALAGLVEALGVCIASTRRIASDLRPTMLDDLGLASAIDWLGQNFRQRTGVPCEVALDDSLCDPGDPHATALFRIVQESLANVAKHARASRASVRLTLREGEWLLRTEDDGCGFDPAHERKPQSLGLVGLHERAQLLGGTVTVESSPGKGTCVEVRMPLPALQAGG